MPKKQPTATAPASSAVSARAAKPRTPRVKTVTHSKTASIETATPVSITIAPEATSEPLSPKAVSPEQKHAAISKIAYGYWEARGHRHGNAHDDWARAEAAYHASH